MRDGFRIELRRLHKEYHARGREGGGEALVYQAPEAVALYRPAGDLFAYYYGRLGNRGGLIFNRNTRPPSRAPGFYHLADFGG